jgi:hypothetical protein
MKNNKRQLFGEERERERETEREREGGGNNLIFQP